MTVGEAARAPVRGRDGRSVRSAETSAARSGRRDAAAPFARAGRALVPFGRPGIDQQPVVEAVDDEASGIAQDNAVWGVTLPLAKVCGISRTEVFSQFIVTSRERELIVRK